jgi:hypothetical protein
MSFFLMVSLIYMSGFYLLSYSIPALTGTYFNPKWYLVWPLALLGVFFLTIVVATSFFVVAGGSFFLDKGMSYYKRNN